MMIYLGSDHGGFALKARLATELKGEGYEVADMGDAQLSQDDDYPDFAHAVAVQVGMDPAGRRGIVICRSGFGVDIVANKTKGVRAALAMSPDHIYQGRHDDDVNVLALAADFIAPEDASRMVKVFITTPFAQDARYARRIEKIRAIEEGE